MTQTPEGTRVLSGALTQRSQPALSEAEGRWATIVPPSGLGFWFPPKQNRLEWATQLHVEAPLYRSSADFSIGRTTTTVAPLPVDLKTI